MNIYLHVKSLFSQYCNFGLITFCIRIQQLFVLQNGACQYIFVALKHKITSYEKTQQF